MASPVYRMSCPECREPVDFFQHKLLVTRNPHLQHSSYLEDFNKRISAVCPKCLKNIELIGDIDSNLAEKRLVVVCTLTKN